MRICADTADTSPESANIVNAIFFIKNIEPDGEVFVNELGDFQVNKSK